MTLKILKENLFDCSIKAGLYLITCLTNQKHYVGQFSYVTRRLNAHKNLLKRGCHSNLIMQKDFHFYGENSFVFQKLLFGTSLSKNTRENFETLNFINIATKFTL